MTTPSQILLNAALIQLELVFAQALQECKTSDSYHQYRGSMAKMKEIVNRNTLRAREQENLWAQLPPFAMPIICAFTDHHEDLSLRKVCKSWTAIIGWRYERLEQVMDGEQLDQLMIPDSNETDVAIAGHKICQIDCDEGSECNYDALSIQQHSIPKYKRKRADAKTPCPTDNEETGEIQLKIHYTCTLPSKSIRQIFIIQSDASNLYCVGKRHGNAKFQFLSIHLDQLDFSCGPLFEEKNLFQPGNDFAWGRVKDLDLHRLLLALHGWGEYRKGRSFYIGLIRPEHHIILDNQTLRVGTPTVHKQLTFREWPCLVLYFNKYIYCFFEINHHQLLVKIYDQELNIKHIAGDYWDPIKWKSQDYEPGVPHIYVSELFIVLSHPYWIALYKNPMQGK